jgi:ubiquinone/menaquinone biosynthesis C-methylase UbiE
MRGIEHVPWLYDASMALCDRGRLGAWRDWLIAGAAGRTLEVGCGTGRNLPRYGTGARPVGIDPDLAALRRARRRAPRVPLVQGRAEALPFRDGAFETVVSSLVFCSVDDPRAGLGELRRVLAPGGALRMLEHVRAPSRGGARLQDLLQPAWTWLTGGCRPNRPTERWVEEAGFRIEPDGRRSRGAMRRFQARAASAGGR